MCSKQKGLIALIPLQFLGNTLKFTNTDNDCDNDKDSDNDNNIDNDIDIDIDNDTVLRTTGACASLVIPGKYLEIY